MGRVVVALVGTQQERMGKAVKEEEEEKTTKTLHPKKEVCMHKCDVSCNEKSSSLYACLSLPFARRLRPPTSCKTSLFLASGWLPAEVPRPLLPSENTNFPTFPVLFPMLRCDVARRADRVILLANFVQDFADTTPSSEVLAREARRKPC